MFGVMFGVIIIIMEM